MTTKEKNTFDKERDDKGRYLPGHGPFKPGESGNPNGRPKNVKYISEGLREYLEAHPKELEKMIQSAVQKSIDGDIPAFREIADRTEGKVPQPIAGDPDNPLQVEVTSILKQLKGYREE